MFAEITDSLLVDFFLVVKMCTVSVKNLSWVWPTASLTKMHHVLPLLSK